MADIKTLHQSNLHVVDNPLEEFKKGVRSGLSQPKKSLSSKFFYDSKGSLLFDQITRHPDYYLTNCELEILENNKKYLAEFLKNKSFNLIELGPGEGIKSEILIKQFLQDNLNFTYIPIDISKNYLINISNHIKEKNFPLATRPIHSDFCTGLEWLGLNSNLQNVVLFLGSSIGNYDSIAANKFLKRINSLLHAGDLLLIGFDLRKDIPTLLRAYNDSSGITKEFNLNLLRRINNELGGNFNVNKFQHYGTYNVYATAMESYLVSLENQMVEIESLNNSFYFQESEAIHVECSYKYLFSEIELLAEANSFELLTHFIDSKNYFVDVLLRVR